MTCVPGGGECCLEQLLETTAFFSTPIRHPGNLLGEADGGLAPSWIFGMMSK